MPCAMPPCCWPVTISGLRMRPQSSTATWRIERRPRPVSRSTSTTATCAPNGNVAPSWSKSSRRASGSPSSAAATLARPTTARRAGTPATPTGRRPSRRCRRRFGLEHASPRPRGPARRRPRSRSAPRYRRAGANASRRCRRRVGTSAVSDWTKRTVLERDPQPVGDDHRERRRRDPGRAPTCRRGSSRCRRRAPRPSRTRRRRRPR